LEFAGIAHSTKRHVFTVLIVSLTLASSALAWDGHRKGFILGAGFGPGSTFYSMKDEAGYEDEVMESHDRGDYHGYGVYSNLKIGYAPTDQIKIYLESENTYFRGEVEIGHTGVSGIGVGYYLKPESPSWYMSAGIGYSTWNPPLFPPFEVLFEEYNYLGFGLRGAVGYEFARHFGVEFNFMWGNPTRDKPWTPAHDGYDYDLTIINAMSVGLTINALGY